MLERSIIFIILGVFVFTPAASSWWSRPYFSWYDVYLPWILLIVATLWIHLQTHKTGALFTPSNQVTPPEQSLNVRESNRSTHLSKQNTTD